MSANPEPELEENPFRVVVDRDMCVGHGRCYSLAPEVYDSDDEGFSEVITDAPDTPELRRQAHLGADTCPEHAIKLSPI